MVSGLRLVDYHVHSRFSPDARSSLSDCCEAAAQRELCEVGFSEHVTALDRRSPAFLERLIAYEADLDLCKSMYPSIEIRFGLEVDFTPVDVERTRCWLEALEEQLSGRLDFVIGAVHEVRGRSLIYPDSVRSLLSESGQEGLLRDYFELELQAASSGLFDIVAHPDLAMKFAGELLSIDKTVVAALARKFLEELLARQVALEINTKGLIHPGRDLHPSKHLLELYFRIARQMKRVPIVTVGSDAHDAERVGVDIHTALSTIREAGGSSIASFRRRVPRFLSLDECRRSN